MDNQNETFSDAIIPDSEIAVKLEIFEGPLDLLLFLIRKNEIDIYNIPIETITKQYLDIIFAMEKLNLELAGEFFVMASTLMYIKSRMLLPSTDTLVDEDISSDENLDPRWELVKQLLEYKKIKEASLDLEDLILKQEDFLPRLVTEKKDENPEKRQLLTSDKIELWNIFNNVLHRLAQKLVYGEIHDEIISTADRMDYILNVCKTKKNFTFSSLFENEEEKGISLINLISSFLAILELTRLKKITLSQDAFFEEININVLDEKEQEEAFLLERKSDLEEDDGYLSPEENELGLEQF